MVALFWSAILNLLLRKPQTAYAHADEAVRLIHEHGMTAILAFASFIRGWTLVQLGHIPEGVFETLQYRTELMQIAGASAAGLWLFLGFADVYLAAGRRNEGLETVGAGLEFAQQDLLQPHRHRPRDYRCAPEWSRLLRTARCQRFGRRQRSSVSTTALRWYPAAADGPPAGHWCKRSQGLLLLALERGVTSIFACEVGPWKSSFTTRTRHLKRRSVRPWTFFPKLALIPRKVTAQRS
jgi:hypothetical protein